MALQTTGHPDRRKYNPDRDMLWALNRFFRRVFYSFGDGSDESVKNLMRANGVAVPAGEVLPAMKKFIHDLTSAIADPHLVETKDPKGKAEELWAKLFTPDDPAYVAIRALVSAMFLKGVVCEMPLWCAMVRPAHPSEPLPDLDDIEEAANDFLDKVRSRRETDRDR